VLRGKGREGVWDMRKSPARGRTYRTCRVKAENNISVPLVIYVSPPYSPSTSPTPEP
jgi:hypothetical protein